MSIMNLNSEMPPAKKRRISIRTSNVIKASEEVYSDDTGYKEALSVANLRRLEYIENQFKQFAQHSQQRTIERAQSISVGRKKKDYNNNIPDNTHRPRVSMGPIDSFTGSPDFIHGEMRDYQIEGLNWMIQMYEHGINGILADEMGLGKTIQSISVLAYLRHHKRVAGPHLVVVPLSTISNWEREFAKFAPDIRVLHGHGYQKQKITIQEKLLAQRRSWDVVITSYDFLTSQVRTFRKLKYQYVIIDEAQRAKNESSLLHSSLRQITNRSMLFLTGTPINNDLHELWALLNLLLPDIFNSSEDFDSWFRVEDCIDPNHEQAVRLKNILQPIMLRRIKADVNIGLQPKVKTTLFFSQTHLMRYWSKRLLCRELPTLMRNGVQTKKAMSNLFSYLREISVHPYLVEGIEPEPYVTDQHIVEASSRMIVLDKLLAILKRRTSRVLIFSQFSVMVQMLADYLDWKDYKFLSLTGDTKTEERQAMLDEFNAPESDKFVFLLTTRAGGLGVNLYTANTVILFDLDWNPQADFQAEDRAHRIGQQQQVHVFRFVVRGTVDETLYKHAFRKQALDKAIIKKSKGECDKVDAIQEQARTMDEADTLDADAVDAQLMEIFEEIDRGERNLKADTLQKNIYLSSKQTRSASEERKLASIKPVQEIESQKQSIAVRFDESGFDLRTRRAKSTAGRL